MVLHNNKNTDGQEMINELQKIQKTSTGNKILTMSFFKHLEYSLFNDHWYDHWSGSKILKRIQIYKAILKVKKTLKMASAQVVETSVANNSPSQDSNHPDDLFQSR